MENLQKINIDIVNHKIYEYIYSKQWDEGREVIFTVTDDNNPVAVGSFVMFVMKKPDGHVVLYSCPIENGKAKLVLSKQMTACAGKIPYQLNIYSSEQTVPQPGESVDPSSYEGTLISTVTGYIVVEPSVVQPADVESSDEFNVVSELAATLGEVAEILADDGQAIIDAAHDSIEYAKISKSYAVGGTDYDHEGVDDDEDNSKYYYGLTKDIYNTCVITKKIVLYADQWDTTEKTQMINMPNVIEDEELQLIVVRPQQDYIREYHNCNVLCIHQGEGYLLFGCDTIPQHDIEVFVMVQTSNSYGDIVTSNIIYYPTEPEPDMHKMNDYWCHSY